MGKVREWVEYRAGCEGYAHVYCPEVTGTLRSAEAEDAAAHAAELDAKDRRIAELEAQLAKRELPPLPDDIRNIVDTLRLSHLTHSQATKLAEFIDATFPTPVPQWELDARLLELVPGVMNAPDSTREEVFAIAARIREAHRGKK